mgnify:CR=1 FL=1
MRPPTCLVRPARAATGAPPLPSIQGCDLNDTLSEPDLSRTDPTLPVAFAAVMAESLVAARGARFGPVGTPLPFDLPRSRVVAVTTRAVLADAGSARLAGMLVRLVPDPGRA